MDNSYIGKQILTASHIEDLKTAASNMRGEKRRSFQAEITLRYCGGSERKAETMFGWGRETVRLGLHEKRTGITCLGAHEACCGRKLWEEKHPEVAEILWDLAESNSQQDPTFHSTVLFTRLTSAEALRHLRDMEFDEEVLPSPGTMAEVLNRNGYRLRAVVKSKPQKKYLKQMPSSTISGKKMVRKLPEAKPNV